VSSKQLISLSVAARFVDGVINVAGDVSVIPDSSMPDDFPVEPQSFSLFHGEIPERNRRRFPTLACETQDGWKIFEN
jgi:hypothetical protein